MWNSKQLLIGVVLLCAVPVGAQTVVGDRVRVGDSAKALEVDGATETVTAAGSGAAILRGDAAIIRQRAPGATKYVSEWFVDSQNGTTTWNSYDTIGNVYTPSLLRALSLSIEAPTSITGTLTVSGNTNVSGWVGHPDFASQTSKWRITEDGAADVRYLYADELHAKAFIADLEQALAGGQIISKSVAVIAEDFRCPATPGLSTLVVEDLPGAPDMQVFEANDFVVVRSFSRASGGLTIGDCIGTVESPDTSATGTQSWVFRRAATNAGAMAEGEIVAKKGLALDFGVSGNGYYEVNAVDGLYGANSPYAQIVTWQTSPAAGNRTVRARFGKLTGITGTADEYGMIAGTYAATNGQYFRASNAAFELHGIDLSIWDGATNVIKLDRVARSFALGSPIPTSYSAGTGVWMGNDAGTYKFRVGVPGGQGIFWDGTNLTVDGSVTVTGYIPTGGAAADVVANVAAPSGSGLFLGSDKMGYFTAGAWTTYMDNAGNFYLGGTSGALQWNGSTLTISATLSGNGAGITSISGGNITTGSVTATQIAASTITASQIAADTITAGQIAASAIATSELSADSVTSEKIVAGTIVASDIAAGSITADRLSVTTLSAITANLGTITAGHINGATAEFGGGVVDLNSSGITFGAGTGSANQVKWSDGSHIESSGGTLNVEAGAGGDLTLEGQAGITLNAGTDVITVLDDLVPNTNNARNLGTSTLSFRDLFLSGAARVGNLSGTGTRTVCVEADGDLIVCP